MTKTHPSNFFEEEFALGYCPNPENYDPNFIGPTWDELLDLLKDEKIKEMYILFCGKARSDGTIGGTGFGLVTQRDVQHVLIEEWNKEGGKIKDISTDPDYTPYLSSQLLPLNVIPEHVTGIVVRKVR